MIRPAGGTSLPLPSPMSLPPSHLGPGAPVQPALQPSHMLTPHDLARWVTITNLPREANEAWLRMVFARICTVQSVELNPLTGPGVAYLQFASPDHARAALTMDGYVALGITLRVSPGRNTTLQNLSIFGRKDSMHTAYSPTLVGDGSLPPGTTPSRRNGSLSLPNHRILEQAQSPPHKNLYILNLPLDATSDQLAALFSAHGTVVHCVILAMLDAQARRRGFIDMSSPQEAKEAIESLNGFVWHGYPIEVSYAIVQRSGGPLSGPNIVRRTVPRSRWNCGPRRQPVQPSASPSPSSGSSERSFNPIITDGMASSGNRLHAANGPETSVCIDPHTIFVTGLDPVAILDDEDFANSLRPFGKVVACSLSRDVNGMSLGYGVASFSSSAEAASAQTALDGKIQNGVQLSCKNLHYTRMPSTSPQMPPLLSLSSVGGLPERLMTPTSYTGGAASAPLCASKSVSDYWTRPDATPSPYAKEFLPLNRSFSDSQHNPHLAQPVYVGFDLTPASSPEDSRDDSGVTQASMKLTTPSESPDIDAKKLSCNKEGAVAAINSVSADGLWDPIFNEANGTARRAHGEQGTGVPSFGPIGSSPPRKEIQPLSADNMSNATSGLGLSSLSLGSGGREDHAA
ncbi:hypothetical protein BCV69DRAFT_299801 [Microstroma glucosiphilum]|uniref:RRM domain-containing protein n=1 Tax=Pseudomicrostroma glucosiphilum TaxID=1684307 RepID=A0A316U6T3_9BASI|nr:hypothetical protein BCV69DRAFT_299801 [Pseudomicrostroma glucosiphilum]PWN20053.1 hypothetical protein BCV69DRAFT_299801 [Pseudomicrostroma glucosiphilum]